MQILRVGTPRQPHNGRRPSRALSACAERRPEAASQGSCKEAPFPRRCQRRARRGQGRPHVDRAHGRLHHAHARRGTVRVASTAGSRGPGVPQATRRTHPYPRKCMRALGSPGVRPNYRCERAPGPAVPCMWGLTQTCATQCMSGAARGGLVGFCKGGGCGRTNPPCTLQRMQPAARPSRHAAGGAARG